MKLSCIGQEDLKVNDSTSLACQQKKLDYNKCSFIENQNVIKSLNYYFNFSSTIVKTMNITTIQL